MGAKIDCSGYILNQKKAFGDMKNLIPLENIAAT
jgi:hypothetical protein